MSYDWESLDKHLKWHKQKGKELTPKSVHETRVGKKDWEVLAERGTRRPGNADLIAIIESSGSRTSRRIESFKSIADDIFRKARDSRDYLKSSFMPALVEVTVLGENPSVALPGRPPRTPGIPPEVLLNALQVIALTESRKYRINEPIGGRFLPIRLCAGIAWGVWDESEITYGVMKQNAVAILRASTGVREPTLGKVLAMSSRLSDFELSRSQLHALSL